MIRGETIERALAGGLFRRVITCGEVDSTNSVARGLGVKHSGEGIVVVADSQRRGKGRHGRSWHSPPGENVYMSLLLTPGCEAPDSPFLVIAAAVGICEALRKSSGLEVRIKWPNDIIVNTRKLGGILAEVQTMGGIVTSAVIGIGINVNSSTRTMPPEIRETATSLSDELGSNSIEREEIIVAVLREIGSLYHRLFPRTAGRPSGEADPEERVWLIRRWTELDITLGRRISAVTSSGIILGTALRVDENGMLHVRTDSGSVEKMSTGDISYVE